jgi:hypothetical protein
MIKSRKVSSEGNVARMGRNAYVNKALVTKPKAQDDGRTFFQSQFIQAITLSKKLVILYIASGSSIKCLEL